MTLFPGRLAMVMMMITITILAHIRPHGVPGKLTRGTHLNAHGVQRITTVTAKFHFETRGERHLTTVTTVRLGAEHLPTIKDTYRFVLV